MPPEPLPAVVALDQLDSLIQHVRGLNVMLDSDLAALYDVETRLLVRAVKRQAARFPQDFCFQLTVDELVGLRSQSGIANEPASTSTGPLRSQSGISNTPTAVENEVKRSQSVISKPGRGGRRYLPYVFTEQGVAMLSSVLHSPRAVAVNIEIMRAFVRMRGLIAGQAELSRRLDELESRYDEQFSVVFDAIRELMAPPPGSSRRLGFATPERDGSRAAPPALESE